MVYAYIAFMANEMQGIFNLNKFQACLNLIFLFYIGKEKYLHQSSNPGFIDNFIVVQKSSHIAKSPKQSICHQMVWKVAQMATNCQIW